MRPPRTSPFPRRLRAPLAAALLAGACVAGGAGAAGAEDGGCAAGPVRDGDTIQGTPCSDTIVVPPSVSVVHGGGGNDTIVAAPITATSDPCPSGCFLGVGSQTFDGGPGDDVVYGERGNDTLNGGPGNDRLYGGIGDDVLRGDDGNDLLSGGFGADNIDGGAGDDVVRGDGTIDTIADTGGGDDTLSFATGVTPGFPNNAAYPDFSQIQNFPTGTDGRGVYVNLETGVADDGVAPGGGGVDVIVNPSDFENVIGTPFDDYIVGNSAANTIHGGGGGDVLIGGEGDDTLKGGAEGDDIDGGAGANTLDGGAGSDHCVNGSASSCEAATAGIVPHDPSKVEAGLLDPDDPSFSDVYLDGSSLDDNVTATYSAGPPETVTFSASGAGAFDQGADAVGGCAAPIGASVTCALPHPLDSIVLAGMAGNDTLTASNFPSSTSVVIMGNDGNDHLTGGATEDVLIDGPGNDVLDAQGGDDAVLNNTGADQVDGGDGNDLFLSNSLCDGDQIVGGSGRDNASWNKYKGSPVEADLGAGTAGRPGASGPDCSGGTLDSLSQIEDLEGTSIGGPSGDVFYGDDGPNQLLGWADPDTYHARGGNDTILANSGDSDGEIDCGDGTDTALIDFPQNGTDIPDANCESVIEGAVNSFRIAPPPDLTPIVTPPARSKTPARVDTTPPQTTLTRGVPKTIRTRKRRVSVDFSFRSTERGSTFSCKIDTKPFRKCSSPEAYRVKIGRHTFKVAAIDAAGNRDPVPAKVTFKVVKRLRN